MWIRLQTVLERAKFQIWNKELESNIAGDLCKYDEFEEILGPALVNLLGKLCFSNNLPNVRCLQRQMFTSHFYYPPAKDGWEWIVGFLHLSTSFLDPGCAAAHPIWRCYSYSRGEEPESWQRQEMPVKASAYLLLSKANHMAKLWITGAREHLLHRMPANPMLISRSI